MRRLERLARAAHTRVAVVSGRPIEGLEPKLGTLPIVLIGEHGWEERGLDGRLVRHPLEPATVALLDRAERLARDAGAGDRLERKRCGLVLHTRGLPSRRARAIAGRCNIAWRPVTADARLVLQPIDGGLELRAGGRNKGTVVRSLLARSSPGTFAVFIGDDIADEEAFGALGAAGLGVRVGASRRRSLARGRLPASRALEPFLAEWDRVARLASVAEAAPAPRRVRRGRRSAPRAASGAETRGRAAGRRRSSSPRRPAAARRASGPA
jgi:trehalose-phosphatase